MLKTYSTKDVSRDRLVKITCYVRRSRDHENTRICTCTALE